MPRHIPRWRRWQTRRSTSTRPSTRRGLGRCGPGRGGTPRSRARSPPRSSRWEPTGPTWSGSSTTRCSAMRRRSPGSCRGSPRCGVAPTPGRTPRRGRHRIRVVHRLPVVAHHARRGVVPGALGAHDLWEAFAEIGIRAVHTGPVKLAGGVSGWSRTPSIDGHFDRISMGIDPMFGTEDEYRTMQGTAAERGATIIDDLVPAHTGKGSDFRLAEMNYRDYPGSTT
ncbi:alpha-amylase family protein [Tessaracoccus coleopterorum]|uniref:alpha-amylase family protein n=1 Tax=Tessaracoccus coleopterorum TaxID=2714950 RepID=UPI0018D46CF5|nr:alpha-amylase family protein [Tessaracoccus coleopterorum]